MNSSRNNFLLLSAFSVILLVGVLHWVASMLYLYWEVWWFDYLMHYLAGLGGALTALWFFKPDGGVKTVLTAFLVLMSVGVLWEIFEYIYGISLATEENYWRDTAHDLVMDGLGALTASLIAWLPRRLS